ncbi:MAG: hypothetical protein M3362_25150 [Acidobacteriota bacterium]|nr:hypothetical protein [Acidobacteriota bacterium]
MNFDANDLKETLDGLRYLVDASHNLFNDRGLSAPSPNSKAANERMNFPDDELITDAHNRGLHSMENAGDHLMLFNEAWVEPAQTVAPWTCARGMLESCALAVWFLDPHIGAVERVGRVLAYRFHGLEEQVKFGRAAGAQQIIDHAEKRMINLARKAQTLGYQTITRGSKLQGVWKRHPGITFLVGATLHHEDYYRLLSGVAHGHHWATFELGYKLVHVPDGAGGTTEGIQKHADAQTIVHAAAILAPTFLNVLWRLWSLFGWDTDEVETLAAGLLSSRLKMKREGDDWEPVIIS